MGDNYWITLHRIFRDKIAPFIQNIHVDFYHRYDTWLVEPNSTVPVANVKEFLDAVSTIHTRYFIDE